MGFQRLPRCLVPAVGVEDPCRRPGKDPAIPRLVSPALANKMMRQIWAMLTKKQNCRNTYLRKLFIHGARTVLHLLKDRSSPLASWADGLKARMHVNVAAVAMANKLARIAWAVLTTGERYRPATAASS